MRASPILSSSLSVNGAVIGGGYSFTPNWGIELEAAYEHIPSDDIIEHEVGAALSGGCQGCDHKTIHPAPLPGYEPGIQPIL